MNGLQELRTRQEGFPLSGRDQQWIQYKLGQLMQSFISPCNHSTPFPGLVRARHGTNVYPCLVKEDFAGGGGLLSVANIVVLVTGIYRCSDAPTSEQNASLCETVLQSGSTGVLH